MQLAASQRTHPPPVPPRPSRQVVAEALKKSPRPPCPTRQAPPPPNQRPWRLEEQQQPKPQENNVVTGGRTIVYDSAHLTKTAPSDGGAGSNNKPSEEVRIKPSVDKIEKKRPAPRDPGKDQIARIVNGKDHKDAEPTKIDDTSKRKDTESGKISNNNAFNNIIINNNNNNNSDSSSSEDSKDKCDVSPDSSIKEIKEGSTERKKKKPHNVTFKEEQQVAEAVVERGNASPVKGLEKRATVVVIDEVEGARIASSAAEEHDNIKRQDWLEAGVRYSSTKITLPAEEVQVVVNGFDHQQQQRQQSTEEEAEEEEEKEEEEEEEEERNTEENQLEFGDLDFSSIIERIAMSSLQGLPPLPRSLSGFNLNGAGLVVEPAPPPPARSSSKSQRAPKTPTSTTSLSSQGSRPSPQGRQLTTLDTQLAILRREMFGLRQLDLSLLSQLWSLNESIQEFRQLLQEQEDRVPSPSPSSEEGDDTSYSAAQPPPPPRRPAPTTPHHHHQYHHHHHHRPARTARSSKLPPSDESPSSEEYGAV